MSCEMKKLIGFYNFAIFREYIVNVDCGVIPHHNYIFDERIYT